MHIPNEGGCADQSHCGSCEGGDCKKETIALLTYMLQHNEHHAAELDQMADNLEKRWAYRLSQNDQEKLWQISRRVICAWDFALTLVKEEMK